MRKACGSVATNYKIQNAPGCGRVRISLFPPLFLKQASPFFILHYPVCISPSRAPSPSPASHICPHLHSGTCSSSARRSSCEEEKKEKKSFHMGPVRRRCHSPRLGGYAFSANRKEREAEREGTPANGNARGGACSSRAPCPAHFAA